MWRCTCAGAQSVVSPQFFQGSYRIHNSVLTTRSISQAWPVVIQSHTDATYVTPLTTHPRTDVVLSSQLAVGVAGDYSVVTPDYQDTGLRDYDYVSSASAVPAPTLPARSTNGML